MHYGYSVLLSSMAEGTIIFYIITYIGENVRLLLGHNIQYFPVDGGIYQGILIYRSMEV